MNVILPSEKTVDNCAATMVNLEKGQVTTRRVPSVGIFVGYAKGLNELRKAYLILVDVV